MTPATLLGSLNERTIAASPPVRIPLGESVAIVGGGNSARALAAWLSSRGHFVHLLVRDCKRVAALRESQTIHVQGQLEGRYTLQAVTDDWSAVADCSTIFVATVTTAYADVARRLAPHLHADHALVLFSGKLAGSLEVKRELERVHRGDVPVLETDALFACRIQSDDSVWIRGIKGWTLYSAPQRRDTHRYGPLLTKFFPFLEPAENVLQRGLTDFGALCHPVTMVANLNAIDRKQPFRFYYDGFTERTVVLLETLECEFNAVAAAYGTCLVPMAQLLSRYYGCETSSLYAAMQSVPNYRHSMAPETLDHRYLTEDVANTLVPLYQLARKAALQTPMLDSIVNLASVVCGEPFLQSGRTLERLGWESMTRDEIVTWMEK